jgi:hypothetical protein
MHLLVSACMSCQFLHMSTVWCCRQLDPCRASIQYKVKADCDQAGLLKPDFKKTATIEVLQRTKAAGPPEPLALAAKEPISFFCCFNKGMVGLQVDGSSDCFLPGESMALRAQVRRTRVLMSAYLCSLCCC